MGLDLRHVMPSSKNDEVDPWDYFTEDELKAFPEFLEAHSSLFVELQTEEKIIKGLYFKELGYQRKGINNRFHKNFENDKLYFELKSVKKAYTYLKGDKVNTLRELQQNFQKNFIDNFAEGNSVFFASW